MRNAATRVMGLLAAAGLVAASAAPAAVAAAERPLVPAPGVECGPGSRPETGMQGRVSPKDHESGRAARGFTCNTKLVGSYSVPTARGTIGGFKTERYVDAKGQECAYYDTTLLFPTNILDGQAGVNVLDMSDPAEPKLATRLLSPAMLSPHESLVLSQKRGLLVAVAGNPATAPGVVDIYDVSADCTNPVLKSSTPTAILGHESGISPDGNTFYAGSAGGSTLVAVDISNPSVPRTLWGGRYASHGLSISDDGTRAYVAGVGGGGFEDSGLIILDTSQVQAREPIPQVTEISRTSWPSMSIPQNALPVTIDGHPYVVEIDEFGALSEVGAGRIIDIADEANPKVVSDLRLEVHQPENFDEISGDPGAGNATGGYSGHYCNVPRRTDPGIVACGMGVSGLRVFDIRDPHHPKEIAYYNSPVKASSFFPGPSNWVLSSPTFAPERGEIWYSDGLTGFHAVRVTNGVWPFTGNAPAAAPKDSDSGEGQGAGEGQTGGSGDGGDAGDEAAGTGPRSPATGTPVASDSGDATEAVATGSLPVTGTSRALVAGLAGLGLVLIPLGVLVLYAARTRGSRAR